MICNFCSNVSKNKEYSLHVFFLAHKIICPMCGKIIKDVLNPKVSKYKTKPGFYFLNSEIFQKAKIENHSHRKRFNLKEKDEIFYYLSLLERVFNKYY